MKIKSFFLIIFVFGAFANQSNAQSKIKEAEQKIVALFKETKIVAYDTLYQKVVPQIRKEIKSVLAKKESWNHDFTALSKYVRITISPDKKIRTFGWDDRTGGSWHSMQSFIQFKINDEVYIYSFQDENFDQSVIEEVNNEVFKDAVILKIYPIGKGYLFEAYGTHGSGHHHKVLAYYSIEKDGLMRKSVFDNDESIYVFKIPRGYELNIKVDTEKQQITHQEFVLDDEIGFFQPTGKKVLLTFNGKKFVKQIKDKKP